MVRRPSVKFLPEDEIEGEVTWPLWSPLQMSAVNRDAASLQFAQTLSWQEKEKGKGRRARLNRGL